MEFNGWVGLATSLLGIIKINTMGKSIIQDFKNTTGVYF